MIYWQIEHYLRVDPKIFFSAIYLLYHDCLDALAIILENKPLAP